MRSGELTPATRAWISLQALAIQSRELTGQLLGIRSDSSSAALSEVPDSRLAAAGLEEARDVLSPAILAHSLRCWQWSVGLARRDGLEPDLEALFVACALHDIALGAEGDPHVGCFALLGAERARGFVAERAAAPTAEVVATAIARHMDPAPPRAHGAEAVLLHAAAHLDVAGYRARDLPPAYARAVVAELPRDGFPGEFGELMRRESVVRPRSTAAALWLSGVRIPLRLNPLNRLGRR